MAASVQKQKIVPKYIVKYLSNYIPISSEDITNPNSERIVDIYWIVCCHIYGESELLESMRGSTLKRLTLVILLRQLFDRLLPTLNPPFTAKDFIFPTKDRTAIFLNAIVNFMKISEAQSDCREKLAEERQKIEERQETLQRELLNMATKKHELHEKSDAIHLEYDNLKDRQLCSLKRSEKKSSQVQTLQEKVEQRKYDVKQRTETTATLSRQIAENQERVEYLQINSLPSKEEFVKALENNKQEVAELEENINLKKSVRENVAKDVELSEQVATLASTAYELVEGIFDFQEKNKEEQNSCDAAIQSLLTTTKDVQAEILTCQRDMENHVEAHQSEMMAKNMTKKDIMKDNEQLEIVLSDETAAQGKLLEEIDKLKDRKTAIKEEAKADEARYQKMLDLEKAGYLRLDELKAALFE